MVNDEQVLDGEAEAPAETETETPATTETEEEVPSNEVETE